MAPQSICCRPHLAKIKRHFLHSKINIKRCNLLSEDKKMLDKEQVAINSILELNEDNVKMKITLTDYERVGFSIFWRINQMRNFFPAK